MAADGDLCTVRDGLLVEIRGVFLDVARRHFAVDRDAGGQEILVGLTRAETNELCALALGDLAGEKTDQRRRFELLHRHRVAIHRRFARAPRARQ